MYQIIGLIFKIDEIEEGGFKVEEATLPQKSIKIEKVTTSKLAKDTYKLTDEDGKKYVAKMIQSDKKRQAEQQLRMLEKTFKSGIPMGKPRGILRLKDEKLPESDYMISDWISGEHLTNYSKKCSDKMLYQLGTEAGKILKQIADLEILNMVGGEWEDVFAKQAEQLLKLYLDKGKRFDGDTHYLDALKEAKKWILNRPTCCLYGNFEMDSLKIDTEKQLRVAYFKGSFGYNGDPYYEFSKAYRLIGKREMRFTLGMMHTYLGTEQEMGDSFAILNIYMAYDILLNVYNETKKASDIIDFAQQHLHACHYDLKKVPTWYKPPQKHLIIINGPAGVGKSTTCEKLRNRLPNSVNLDGEYLWDMNPRPKTKAIKKMYRENVDFVLKNFLSHSEIEYVIYHWLSIHAEDFEQLKKRLELQEDVNVYRFNLVCSDEDLMKRIVEQPEKKRIFEKSKELMEICVSLGGITIDSTGKDPREVAQEIIAHL